MPLTHTGLPHGAHGFWMPIPVRDVVVQVVAVLVCSVPTAPVCEAGPHGVWGAPYVQWCSAVATSCTQCFGFCSWLCSVPRFL